MNVDFKNLNKILDNFVKSFQYRDLLDINYIIECDVYLNLYNINIIININNTKYSYIYNLLMDCRWLDVYDMLITMQDDIIYFMQTEGYNNDT